MILLLQCIQASRMNLDCILRLVSIIYLLWSYYHQPQKNWKIVRKMVPDMDHYMILVFDEHDHLTNIVC